MHNLKYRVELERADCNLSEKEFKERQRVSYRWVFSTIEDKKNFLPVNKRNQDRGCRGFALSFFITAEQASKHYYYYINNKANLRKKLGTHLAKGVIEKSHGKSDNSNSIGHFSHFEYKNINLNTVFEIIEAL